MSDSMGNVMTGAERTGQDVGEIFRSAGQSMSGHGSEMGQLGREMGAEQQEYFRLTDQIPAPVWYWASLGSILIAAIFKLMGKDNWALFVGQWPPTFLLFGLYHKLVKPSRGQ